jgi:hypothetical protein
MPQFAVLCLSLGSPALAAHSSDVEVGHFPRRYCGFLMSADCEDLFCYKFVFKASHQK